MNFRFSENCANLNYDLFLNLCDYNDHSKMFVEIKGFYNFFYLSALKSKILYRKVILIYYEREITISPQMILNYFVIIKKIVYKNKKFFTCKII